MTTHPHSSSPAVFPLGAFRRMGWAFLLVGITIGPTLRLGQDQFVLDLLPDFIGFLMIATAANRLLPFLRQARGIRNLAMALVYLTIPTILQYSVVTSHGANVSTWKSPLWPLMIVQSLLELILVWKLCGLVAHLARRVGDVATEQRARAGRIVYAALKTMLTVGLGFVVLLQNPSLILTGVIGGVTIGLAMMIVMMQVMWRAERMCAVRPEVDLPEASERPGGSIFRLWAIGSVLLPLGLAGWAMFYYWNWDEGRKDEYRRTSSSSYFMPAHDEFFEHLHARRIDEAYESTTVSFRNRVSREQFGELARRYADYRALRDNGGGRASGSSMSSGSESLIESDYVEIEPGRVLQVTVAIRRERDSIFLRTPPPVKVDDFIVEEKAMPERAWPPRAPGR